MVAKLVTFGVLVDAGGHLFVDDDVGHLGGRDD